jgi:hypothetical protein
MRGFDPRLGLLFKNTKRGYSLIGKTAILHIVILGSSPNISIGILYGSLKLYIVLIFFIENKVTILVLGIILITLCILLIHYVIFIDYL